MCFFGVFILKRIDLIKYGYRLLLIFGFLRFRRFRFYFGFGIIVNLEVIDMVLVVVDVV